MNVESELLIKNAALTAVMDKIQTTLDDLEVLHDKAKRLTDEVKELKEKAEKGEEP